MDMVSLSEPNEIADEEAHSECNTTELAFQFLDRLALRRLCDDVVHREHISIRRDRHRYRCSNSDGTFRYIDAYHHAIANHNYLRRCGKYVANIH